MCLDFVSWAEDFGFCNRYLPEAFVDADGAQVTFLWRRYDTHKKILTIDPSYLKTNIEMARLGSRGASGIRYYRSGDITRIISPIFNVNINPVESGYEAVSIGSDVVFGKNSFLGSLVYMALERLSQPNIAQTQISAFVGLLRFAVQQVGLSRTRSHMEYFAEYGYRPENILRFCRELDLPEVKHIKELEIPRERVFHLYRYFWEARKEEER